MTNNFGIFLRAVGEQIQLYLGIVSSFLLLLLAELSSSLFPATIMGFHITLVSACKCTLFLRGERQRLYSASVIFAMVISIAIAVHVNSIVN